jgi:acetyl esterase
MPLDPIMAQILEAMPSTFEGENLKLHPSVLRAKMAENPLAGEGPAVARVENRTVPGPAGNIPVRIYWPDGSGPFPVLVYYHGGGFVLCDLDSHDATCRLLTNGAGCITVSVVYRLAPESKFPAAPEDCYAATCWAAENAAELGGDPSRIAVGGDSAGGNLAAAVPLMARERGGPALVHQLLIYPVTTSDLDAPSYTENAEGYMLTREAMAWFWSHYLVDAADGAHPHASPLRAQELSGLPPATVITAEFDPLRDEGEAYGQRLSEAGVDVDVRRYDGVIHGFFAMVGALPHAQQALDQACARLRGAFA